MIRWMLITLLGFYILSTHDEKQVVRVVEKVKPQVEKVCKSTVEVLPKDIFKVKTLEKNLCKTDDGDTIVYRTVEKIKTEVFPMVTDSTPITIK